MTHLCLGMSYLRLHEGMLVSVTLEGRAVASPGRLLTSPLGWPPFKVKVKVHLKIEMLLLPKVMYAVSVQCCSYTKMLIATTVS